ncbi:hypothetical protein [Helicobacter pylori]|nr:hypothetical protein [Helicobacter pylori]
MHGIVNALKFLLKSLVEWLCLGLNFTPAIWCVLYKAPKVDLVH